MEGKRRTKVDSDSTAQNAKEEIVLFLFRGLPIIQQRKVILNMRALIEANRVSRSHMGGKPLRTVSDEDVKAAFKTAPTTIEPPAKPKKKPPGRPPDAAMPDQ